MISAFDKDATMRYSRQLLLPNIGVDGQLAICSTSVLIVGAGGLGSPVALYLAAAGIQSIGILDYDTVDLSNLHRQIIHSEQSIDSLKVDSAKDSISRLNSRCIVSTYPTQLRPSNAFEIVEKYDIIVDASDNAPTRYLLNDIAIITHKPLVSASAIRTEGQLSVFAHNPNAPCYRCLFPLPSPPSSMSNCEEGGVVGCIVGVLGSMQAMEVLKIAIEIKTGRKMGVLSGKMILYDALGSVPFRTVTLRNRSLGCAVCGDQPSIGRELVDYEVFCGTLACEKSRPIRVLSREDRISCETYAEVVRSGQNHYLIDVRDEIQFKICSLPRSLHFPLDSLDNSILKLKEKIKATNYEDGCEEECQVFVICRRGNRSQHAVQILEKHGIKSKDIIGGLKSWQKEVDPNFPIY